MGWVEDEVTVAAKAFSMLSTDRSGAGWDRSIPGSSLQLHVLPKLAGLPLGLVILFAGPEMKI